MPNVVEVVLGILLLEVKLDVSVEEMLGISLSHSLCQIIFLVVFKNLVRDVV